MNSVRFHDSKLKLVKALLFRSFHETEAPTAGFVQRLFVKGRISGEQAHGGVALLWKYSINDFVTPIKSIQSDRNVGIKCEFSGCRPLFILGVYLPSSNHTFDEFQECLDLLWAFYESLSADGFVIVLGDVNGDFGNCLGVRGKKEPNVRGKLLIDFANFFNVCPVNLLSSCSGPLETYISRCGRFRSTF